MKVFVNYAFTGEDETTLAARLRSVKDVLDKLHIDSYINMFSPDYSDLVEQNAPSGEYIRSALPNLQASDMVLVLNTSPRRSEGMLMEVGAALAWGKKIILAQHVSSTGKTYLPTLADETLVWRSDEELLQEIERLFSNLNKEASVKT